MSSTLGASLLRTVLSDGTLKILGSGLDKGPIIIGTARGVAKNTEKIINDIQKKLTDEKTKQDLTAKARKPKTLIEDLKKATKDAILGTQKNLEIFEKKMPKAKSSGLESFGKQNPFEKAAAAAKILEREL